MRRRKTLFNIGKTLLWTAILAVALGAFFNGLQQVRQEVAEQGKAKLEDAVRRAAVACYAAEGAYPPDVAYLIEHYGLTVDESRFIVHYDVFAENLMPDITVLDNEQ